jgi:hypothetical protein
VQRIHGEGLVIVVALAVVAGGLRAQEATPLDSTRWMPTESEHANPRYFLDTKTMRMTGDSLVGDTVTAWVAMLYHPPRHSGGLRVTDGKVLYRFDCAGHRSAQLDAVFYNGVDVVVSNDVPTSWEPVIPDSDGEWLLKWACTLGPVFNRSARHLLQRQPPDTSRSR